MDKHTTVIGEEEYRSLLVEWNVYTGGRLQLDGTLPARQFHRVTLVQNPGMRFLGDGPERTRIIDLSPQTALNLLVWLDQERAALQAEVDRLKTMG